ncbi:hypothetical protein CAL7716_100610 (plasmid) [Calothrix sp. PCC 7716]|nr:hypothetical protein CAL7716_100610 [Calothrix sp. PCC 7716]
MKHKLDSNGNLTENYIARCRGNGWSEADIEKEGLRLQTEYQKLRKLDEEAPEEWVDYTAYEAIFTSFEQEILNFDGSVREDYLEKIAGDGRRVDEVMALSAEKMEAVREFNRLVEYYRPLGINHAKDAKDSFDKQNVNTLRPLNEREITDLRNFEESSALAFGMEPDEYQAATQALSQFDTNSLDTDDMFNRNP